jgi:hypothetical protein
MEFGFASFENLITSEIMEPIVEVQTIDGKIFYMAKQLGNRYKAMLTFQKGTHNFLLSRLNIFSRI